MACTENTCVEIIKPRPALVALKFTCEFDLSASLSFLDVLVERVVDGGFVTNVYWKPTFTGMRLKWDSFCPVKYKIVSHSLFG